MEDCDIIALYFARSEEAIAETERKYGSLCRQISRNILCDPLDAEECVSDVYHTLWNRIPPQHPLSLAAFLGRITRNTAISRYRANHARKRSSSMEILLGELDECIPAPDDVEQALDRSTLTELLNDWLDALDADDRALFIRRYWYGDAVAALAQATGCRPNQMAQRMRRLRGNLRTFLEQEGVSL